ncbi:MAG: hypothetical protein JXL85_00625 [Bacilli bacterium]|nr:hypothetical protein [Bacilli bacterium]
MAYGKGDKGWFKTYVTAMKNSFKYAERTVDTTHQKWITRGFAILFSLIWYLFTCVVFIVLPIMVIVLLVYYLIN